MRHVIFKDKKINNAEFGAWQANDEAFWKKYIEVTPDYWIIERDFSSYPVELDGDGDLRPTKSFLTALTDEIFSSYGPDGTDFIIVLIHEDNWMSSGANFNDYREKRGLSKQRGIWGTNYSNVYRNYHVQYCRWDDGNAVNSFGTMYHERHHAFDALVKTEIGVDIRPLINVNNWDAGCTHGGESPWSYIRNKENTDSLKAIAPHLRDALIVRKNRHIEYTSGLQRGVISALKELVYWLQVALNRKNGVSKTL